MTEILVSYSRVDRGFVEALADKIRRISGHDNVWFDESLHGGDIWWEEILDQIAARDIFIYVLTNESVQSPYCQAEFAEARRLQKQIITVQARDRTRLTDELGDIHYVNMAGGVEDADALTELIRSINKRVTQVPRCRPKPLWEPRMPRPDRVDEEPRADGAPDVDTPTLQVPRAERENAVTAATKPWWRKPEFVIGAILVPIIVVGISVLPPLLSQHNNQPTPTLSPDQLAWTPVARNADWTPYTAVFNDVEMVLVPAGCFMMGSADGYDDERPVHEVCFEEPFWLDKTEVTRAMYQQCVDAGACTVPRPSDYSTEPDQPINRVTWFEADAYCQWRDTRLPTEAEWEYAARGPDGLVYPWGNEFIGDNVIYRDSAVYGDTKTAPVGSRPNGVSWTGALDVSGNVWEWVADWYGSYSAGTQVNPQGPDSGQYRVFRGGSFNDTSVELRAACRGGDYPDNEGYLNGFRCARSQ